MPKPTRRNPHVPSATRNQADGAPRPRGPGNQPRLGLALLVIATAQLMVVLDATIVNVALPHIQRALGFSGSGLEWVVNAYALAFGGLMLLGGRAGDLLGRRKVFIAGLLLFSAASLAGGFATSQAWLLAARAVQGAGAAIIAATALALITTTFREGKPRNRAMGVYAAMSVAGGAVGLIAGGVLTTYRHGGGCCSSTCRSAWRRPWPRRGCSASPGGSGAGSTCPARSPAAAGSPRWSTACPTRPPAPNGVSHWGDAKVVASLAASAVLLAAFAVIETRSQHSLLPLRLLADRNRTGANLIMLCVGAAIFGMFFFLTVFMQSVWGYSALKTGLAYLPLTAGIMVSSGAAAQLIPRVGARPLLLAGAPTAAGGLYWLSRLSEHGSYADAVLGPMLVIAAGLGLLFVPLTLVAMSRVADEESGVAASLRNTGQQVGGSIGLAVLGTVAWTVVADSIRARPPARRPPPPGPATRRGPARQRSPRSTTTPWPPASPAPSWSRPASCCSA